MSVATLLDAPPDDLHKVMQMLLAIYQLDSKLHRFSNQVTCINDIIKKNSLRDKCQASGHLLEIRTEMGNGANEGSYLFYFLIWCSTTILAS